MTLSLPGRIALGALLTLLSSAPAVAQSPEAIPESVVLLLNVLSETHARPTTGVVVSPTGQVLVSAAFVGRGDRIVILANGNSLETDAVETRTAFRSTESGLAVLAAPELNRAPMNVTAESPGDGERLSFVAFPLAEQLAEGAPPIRETIRILVKDGRPEVSADTPLPNTAGALVNRCGHLAGMVLANREAVAGRGPGVIWPEGIRKFLGESGVSAESQPCGAAGNPRPEAADSSAPARANTPQILDRENLQPTGPNLELSSVPADTAEPDPSEAGMTATDGAGGPVDRPVTRPVAEPAEASNPAAGPAAGDPGNRASATAERGLTPGQGAWLVVLLLMTAAGSWWLGRRSRRATPPKTPTMPEGPGKSAPGGAKVEEPVSELLTLEFDAVMPDGTAKKLSCRLHGTHGSSLVGSGPVDLVIPDSSLSRVHGRIQGSDGILLYGDAGSNQGSWVDGVACLEGELFRIHEGSSLVLGAVHLALTSVRPEAGASDE